MMINLELVNVESIDTKFPEVLVGFIPDHEFSWEYRPDDFGITMSLVTSLRTVTESAIAEKVKWKSSDDTIITIPVTENTGCLHHVQVMIDFGSTTVTDNMIKDAVTLIAENEETIYQGIRHASAMSFRIPAQGRN